MAGCTGLASVDAARLLLAAGGVATFGVPIPNDPVFAGLALFNQAFVLDPAAATAIGLTASNGGRAVVGF